MHIPSTAVNGLFAFIIQASGPESSIVADYFDATVVEGQSPLKEAIVLRQFVENEDSSLKFGIQAGKGEDFSNNKRAGVIIPPFFQIRQSLRTCDISGYGFDPDLAEQPIDETSSHGVALSRLAG